MREGAESGQMLRGLQSRMVWANLYSTDYVRWGAEAVLCSEPRWRQYALILEFLSISAWDVAICGSSARNRHPHIGSRPANLASRRQETTGLTQAPRGFNVRNNDEISWNFSQPKSAKTPKIMLKLWGCNWYGCGQRNGIVTCDGQCGTRRDDVGISADGDWSSEDWKMHFGDKCINLQVLWIYSAVTI